MGILYALASLLFAGLNDFLFKQYMHGRRHPLGWFVAGVGVVWTAVFGAALLWTGQGFTGRAWPVSVGAGVASVLGNLLFIGSFRDVPAGTGSTIYRLNLVLVVLLGVTLLHERLTGWKVAGAALGLAAVLLIRNGEGPAGARLPGRALAALAGACVLRAGMGILYKLAALRGIPSFEMLAVGGAAWIAGGLAFAALRRETASPPGRLAAFSGASGALVCGIVLFMLEATRLAEASVAVPITQLSFVVTTALGAGLHRERMTGRKAAALAAAGACIWALSRS